MLTCYMVDSEHSQSVHLDKAAADRHVSFRVRSGGRVVKMVDEAAILKKFEDYVPADVASSMRWRIQELEEQVKALQASTMHLACASAGHCTATPACPPGCCSRAAVTLHRPPVAQEPRA
jgi:hypothetical protein